MIKNFLLLSMLPLSIWAAELNECLHLLNRSSFGVQQNTLSECLSAPSYEDAVKQLVYTAAKPAKVLAPLCAQNIIRPPRKIKDLNATERKAFRKMKHGKKMALKRWYFEQLVTSDQPFREHMTLFWHDHFTSSLRKVNQPALVFGQYQLYRGYALGNFARMLHAVIEDPAMLIYLDNRASKKNHPNENLARELLELFTMGEGHYGEREIKELARGLTGYSIDKDFQFRFKKRLHDFGPKEFFGRKGALDAHQMIDIILEQNATAEYIVTKLWKTYISSMPEEKEVKRLAKLFRRNNYDIQPLMMALFTSAYFTDPTNRGGMTKSPIELIVGSLRNLGYTGFDSGIGVKYCRRMGQDLFDPPNVKGWPEGKTWIDTNSLLTRREFLSRLTRGEEMQHFDKKHFQNYTVNGSIEAVAARILLPVGIFVTPANNFNDTLRTILKHPLYQLK